MFTLTKHTTIVAVGDVKINLAFEHAGEVYVRIKEPLEPVALKVGKDSVLAISIETWHLDVLPVTTEVIPCEVTAISKNL